MSSTSKTKGRQTADAAIHGATGLISAILIETDGTNDATLTIYDNTAASGTVVFKAIVTGTADTRFFPFNFPLRVVNGVYADIAGTGAAYTIYVV